jgi:hypothetical protein
MPARFFLPLRRQAIRRDALQARSGARKNLIPSRISSQEIIRRFRRWEWGSTEVGMGSTVYFLNTFWPGSWLRVAMNPAGRLT